jgi:molybdenum cofactor cytidylyltransferase
MMPILILAAGASTRMRGRDKLMEVVDGVPLLRRQAMMALSVSDDVRIALPRRPHPRYDALDGLKVTPVEVADAEDGMSASLRTLFGTLTTAMEHAMLLLADLPDLAADDLRQVAASVNDAPDALIWRGATAKLEGGHPMIFHKSLFSRFSALEGDTGGQDVVAAAGTRVHLVPLRDRRARLDLDTPEDWSAWRATRS